MLPASNHAIVPKVSWMASKCSHAAVAPATFRDIDASPPAPLSPFNLWFLTSLYATRSLYLALLVIHLSCSTLMLKFSLTGLDSSFLGFRSRLPCAFATRVRLCRPRLHCTVHCSLRSRSLQLHPSGMGPALCPTWHLQPPSEQGLSCSQTFLTSSTDPEVSSPGTFASVCCWISPSLQPWSQS